MTGYTLSPHPHGEFEPSPRWVRVYFNGQLVADSRNMMLLRENNRLPVYFFPKDDVQWDCLQPSDHKADPGPKGDGVFWHIGVAVDGVTVAESHRPWLLFETGLPTRYYVPKHDARLDLLEPSETDTRCPYKGEANLYSIRIGEKLHRDLAWTYRYPMLECLKIQGLLGFLNEKVDLYEDGEPLPRPDTAWS